MGVCRGVRGSCREVRGATGIINNRMVMYRMVKMIICEVLTNVSVHMTVCVS